jgi:tetratricopeptide (TPR) repeat protein
MYSEVRGQKPEVRNQSRGVWQYATTCLDNRLFCILFSVFCFLSVSALASEDKLKTADQYLQAKNYIKAKEVYRDIFLAAPKGTLGEKALFGMGKADYYLKNYYEARQNIKRFISASQIPEYRDEAYLLLGYISLHFKKLKEAGQYFDAVGESMREKAIIGKAEIALKIGDIATAEHLLTNMSKRSLETDPRAIYIRAMVYSSKGMQREAVNTINKVLDSALKEQDIRVEKARIFFNARKLKDAEMLCRAIIYNPTSGIEKFNAQKVLLQLYEVEGKVDEALKLGLELLPYESTDEFKLKIVSLYDKKGDLNNAMKYLSYLSNKKMRSAEIEKRLKILIASNDPKAVEYVQKFSIYLDADAPFIIDASRYLIVNGKKFEGRLLLGKALKGAVKGEASLYMADLLIQEGKYAGAEKMLTPLTMDTRYLYKASYMVADIMERQGKYAAAIEYLTRIVKTAADYRIAAKLGDLYYKAGDRQNAVKYYIIASNKGDGLSSVKAGDCLYISGNYTKAKIFYRRALDLNLKDPKTIQWVQYQYGKLTKNMDYLKKAISGGGEIAEAATMISGGK